MVLGALLVGLIGGALVIRDGWQLPVRESCEGDVCFAGDWFDVDWGRADWALRPARLACFEVNPGPHSKLIGPGDECVRARGDGVVVRRATYEQLREEAFRRRAEALVLAGAVTVTPVVLAVARARCRTRRRRSAPGRAAPAWPAPGPHAP
jgi:hypothetical protein